MLLNINVEQKHLNHLSFPGPLPNGMVQFIDEFRPVPNSVFNIHNIIGIKLLTSLRLGLSHLNEHRFNHKVQNCTSLKFICSSENESTPHFSSIVIFTFL